MALFLDAVAVAAGLALGSAVGYWIGVKFCDDRRILWSVAVAAFVSAAMINFAGQLTGRQWLEIGSIGLMAGIITGVKYGGFPEVRVWEKPPNEPGK